MADSVWKGVYPWVLGRSCQLLLNKFFDPSIPSMRKVDDGKRKEKKRKKRMTFLVATTSLTAVYRLNDDRWNAARSCQNDLYAQKHVKSE